MATKKKTMEKIHAFKHTPSPAPKGARVKKNSGKSMPKSPPKAKR